jgi:hypothetical protein
MTTDIGFLRRRVKPNAAQNAPAPAAARPRIALFADSVPPSAIPPVPVATSNVTLTESDPAIRLSRIASGIGSLLLGGITVACLETTNGAGHRLGHDPIPAFGNRPLAEHHDGAIVIGLRHVRQLRRFVATGTDMTITTAGGLTIRVPGHADLGIHTVAGHLELRRDSPSPDLAQTYSIGAPV